VTEPQAANVESVPTPAPAHEAPQPAADGARWGTGRRKTSVARVRVKPGAGKFVINQRTVEQYFSEPQHRQAVLEPLIVTDSASRYDLLANVSGGGYTGQAGAIRLGVARALVQIDAKYEPALRDKGLLTRDARKVERKKYGRRKARRRFQFSKR